MNDSYPYRNFGFRNNLDKVKRSRQIISVFVKFGLDYLFEASRVNFLSKLRKRRKVYHKLSTAERLRLAFEELGPTFIKFGQILSTRPDFLPAEYIRELEKLQDQVLPMETPLVRQCIEKELKHTIEELFLDFDQSPVASASLSQVHKAVLQNGDTVALKIQRPDIHKTIETDLSILESFAEILEKRLRNSSLYHPTAIVAELKKTIRKELDFMNEAHNFEKFRKNFKNVDYIQVPKVYWQFTTEKLLTMEFIEGVKITEITQEKYQHRYEPKKVADRAAKALLKQILIDGFFHADPHPGNLFIQPPATIVMLDVGMTGHLDEESIITIARILRAVNEKDSNHIIKGLQELGIVVKETDKRQLRHDLTELIEMYADRPFRTISLNRMNQQLLEIMARHDMALPSNLVMMLRAMSIAESIGQQLEPDFDMFAIVEPFVKRIYLKLYSPKSFRKRSMNVMDESIELIEHFPQNISDLLGKLKEGQFEIKLEHQNLENLQDEMKSSSNRISASLIIAALIVGSSLILQQRIGPLISDISILGVIGYLLAGIMGLGLLLTIFKTRRKK